MGRDTSWWPLSYFDKWFSLNMFPNMDIQMLLFVSHFQNSYNYEMIYVVNIGNVWSSNFLSTLCFITFYTMNHPTYQMIVLSSHWTIVAITCDNDPCKNGATCFTATSGTGFVCLCASGWEGDTCETNSNSKWMFVFIQDRRRDI